MNVKGFSGILLGEKMPRTIRNIKERYERDVDAGRRSAGATRRRPGCSQGRVSPRAHRDAVFWSSSSLSSSALAWNTYRLVAVSPQSAGAQRKMPDSGAGTGCVGRVRDRNIQTE